MLESIFKRLSLLSNLLLLILLPTVFCHNEGDFLQILRRSTFHNTNTDWHELPLHHSPRFGLDRLVSLPLPKPVIPFLQDADSYKIQFALNEGSLLTSWVPVLGKDAPKAPLVIITIRRGRGGSILGATAEVLEAPQSIVLAHPRWLQDLHSKNTNATVSTDKVWPKHVLVQYVFKRHRETDLGRGVGILMAIGLVAFLASVANAARDLGPRLAAFLLEPSTAVADVGSGVSSYGNTGFETTAPVFSAPTRSAAPGGGYGPKAD